MKFERHRSKDMRHEIHREVIVEAMTKIGLQVSITQFKYVIIFTG